MKLSHPSCGIKFGERSRPLNGSHKGLNEILYKISAKENDIFIYYNIFKVLTKATNEKYNFHFNVANSMSNEIDAKIEGKLIEYCFRFYFDSSNQTCNTKNEKGELVNKLKIMSENNKINSIQVWYEWSQPSDYGCFYSSNIEPKINHVYTVKIENDEATLSPGISILDDLNLNNL